MKKEDIEKILDLSFLLGREKYAKDVSLVDIYDLSCRIWEEIQKEPTVNRENIVKYYLFNNEEWEDFKYLGSHRIDINKDCTIELLYKPYGYRLESGDIIDSEDYPNLDEQPSDPFLESCFNCQPAVELGSHITDWIIDHIEKIKEVLGFDIQNIEKNKELEGNPRVDLYGKDNFGNSIVIYCDKGLTTDETLKRLLFNAIVSDSEKVVWIANAIHYSHKSIINWLNMNHYGYMMFYLIEATRFENLDNKHVGTSFQLVESPDKGKGIDY